MTLPKGTKNCITDVPDVQVGHVTLYEHLNETDTICTGVTAILPHSGNYSEKKSSLEMLLLMALGKRQG